VVVDVVGTKTLQNEPFLASKEKDLIWALKETMQSPSPGPFQKHDINWLLHVTIRHGSYNHTENRIISWDQLKDFVQGEQNYLEFPCKFTRTKEHKICNPPNTLTHPRANSAALVYKCSFISNVILLLKNVAVGLLIGRLYDPLSNLSTLDNNPCYTTLHALVPYGFAILPYTLVSHGVYLLI
jgi:hypothetical protein